MAKTSSRPRNRFRKSEIFSCSFHLCPDEHPIPVWDNTWLHAWRHDRNTGAGLTIAGGRRTACLWVVPQAFLRLRLLRQNKGFQGADLGSAPFLFSKVPVSSSELGVHPAQGQRTFDAGDGKPSQGCPRFISMPSYTLYLAGIKHRSGQVLRATSVDHDHHRETPASGADLSWTEPK